MVLRDITESFKKAVKIDKNVILDNYILKEGLYLRLDVDKNIEDLNRKNYLIIKKNDEIPVDKIELYKWFKERDYLSICLNNDSNKYVDQKKGNLTKKKQISSTNIYTIYIKSDKLPIISKNNEAMSIEGLKERISLYYKSLSELENKFIEMYPKNRKKNEKNIEMFFQTYFKKEIDYLRSNKRKNAINEYNSYFNKNIIILLIFLNSIIDKHNIQKNINIKMFINNDLEDYEIENLIYIKPNIFNSNQYNILVENSLVGLPCTDINTNEKKPYCLLKTMKCLVTDRNTADNVIIMKCFYDWLQNEINKKDIKDNIINLEYDFNYCKSINVAKEKPYFFIHTGFNNKKFTIDEFDNIPVAEPSIDFVIENVTQVSKWDNDKKKYSKVQLQENILVKSLNQLQKLISKYYFNDNMKGYFKDYEPSIVENKFTGTLKVLFMKSREAFFDYFHKGIDTNIKGMIDEITISSIEEQIRKTVKGNKLNDIRQAYNIRLSLLKYFKVKGGSMMSCRIGKLVEKIKNKIRSHEIQYCESDEEFYFLAGQLSYYIVSQSEAKNKTFGLFEPFLLAKNSRQLKRKLADVFEIYKHAIYIDNIKFKNAMAMVMGYETEASIKDEMKDMLLAGLLFNNMFYEKNKKEEEINEK